MIRLITLDPSRRTDWAELIAAFDGGAVDGSGFDAGEEIDTSEAGFGAYLEHRLGEADTAREPAPERVHCTYRWIEQDGRLVGFLAIRHALNRFLFDVGGHIGYSVRPDARRRGVATAALAAGVEEARALGIDPVLVTCREDNEGSRRTIEANGGRLDGGGEGGRLDGGGADGRLDGGGESGSDGMRRYWIGAAARPTRPAA